MKLAQKIHQSLDQSPKQSPSQSPNQSPNIRRGFTLIELSLALAFISALMVVVTIITIHISTTYHKGLVIRSINSTGRSLVDDFSRTIAAAPTRSLADICRAEYASDRNQMQKCLDDNARIYTYQQNYGSVRLKSTGAILHNVPLNGVFCTGRHSYIWNTGYALNDDDYEILSGSRANYDAFVNGDRVDKNDFKLLKVEDNNRDLCYQHTYMRTEGTATYGYKPNENNYYMKDTIITELLYKTDDRLVLYDFVIFPPTQHAVTLHSFYSGTFVLGTERGSIDITGIGEFCKAPPSDGLSTDFTYCAINKFNFAARSTGQNRKGE